MSFRLLNLLAEVRYNIYKYALGPRLYLLSRVSEYLASDDLTVAQASVHWGSSYMNIGDWRRKHHKYRHLFHNGGVHDTTIDHSIEALSTALLRVSTFVYEDARKVGWENTRKCFHSVQLLFLILRTGVKPNFNWLNKFVLDFNMRDWFKFLGVKTHPYFRINDTNSSGHIPQTLPQLEDLQTYFRRPYDGYCHSPVWNAYGFRGEDRCQRTMVDWIMTFLWPFIMRIGKVVLGDAIKRGSKPKWDVMLTQLIHRKEMFDQAQKRSVIFNTSRLLLYILNLNCMTEAANSRSPPPCSCRTSCKVEYGNREMGNEGCAPGTDKFDYGDHDDGELAFDFEQLEL
ncbi:hypothetical protein N0V86_003113 [Didymella sp. IMI 355093]|nr:hypothetical protein N0V86_003113 [Didymella sp. IMI 355093]